MEIVTPTIPPFIIFLIVINVLPTHVDKCQLNFQEDGEARQIDIRKIPKKYTWRLEAKGLDRGPVIMFNDGKTMTFTKAERSANQDTFVRADIKYYAEMKEVKRWKKAKKLHFKKEYDQSPIQVVRQKKMIKLVQKKGFIASNKVIITW